MSVRCFFSGVESPQHFQACVSADVKHVLTSYWQFFRSNPGTVAARKSNNPDMKFLIDSGAHSFLEDWTKFKTWTEQTFESYVQQYVKWLLQNRKNIFAAVELDIDYCLNMVLGGDEKSTIGSSIIERWQRTYFRPLQEKGISIIYVWHENRGMDGWEDMCSRFDYVGLPGEFSSKTDFNKYMTIARRYTTKVHGFAATKQKDFRDIPWASIDSITWKTGEMYGTLIIWDAHTQTLSFEDDKTKRVNYRQMYEKNGFNAEGIINDTDYKEVTRFSLWSMRQMEAFYADKYKDRVFYYQLRLPHRRVIEKRSPKWLNRRWKSFRPDVIFRQHSHIGLEQTRDCLIAISAVQFGDSAFLAQSPRSIAFLKQYFPKLADPLISDIRVFQRELSYMVSPPNQIAMPRTEAEHAIPNSNAPKARVESLANQSLAADWERHPLTKDL